MQVYNKLYLDEDTKKKPGKLLKRLGKRKLSMKDIYVISVATTADYFDITPAYVMMQKAYPVADLMVMGLAKGEDSAVTLASQMMTDFTARYETAYFKEAFLAEGERLFRKVKM